MEDPTTPPPAPTGADQPGQELNRDNLGAHRVRIQVDVPHGARLRIKVFAGKAEAGQQPEIQVWQEDGLHLVTARIRHLGARLPGWLAFVRAWPAQTWLFLGAVLVYLVVRLVGLSQFPIYFFTDEAIQTMSAVDLLRNSLRGPDGTFLPTYFQNGPYFNLSLTVYLQVLPALIFGRSVFLTRAVSVLVSLAAALSVGLILKQFFKVRYWWVGTLLLSITPAWFLHSRTAFETVAFASLYAAFLFVYLLYRCKSADYLYLSITLAGLAFYTYSPGQLIIGATGALLFFSDLPYHWQHRSRWLRAGLLALALALPYIRFRLQNSFDPGQHLRLLDSYWIHDLPLKEKLARFWVEYSRGLSIRYWYYPEQQDLARHVMKGYGNIFIATLPFLLVGLVEAMRKLRQPAPRTILVAALCAPLGSALVGIGITRVLVFVIPAAILTGLGLSAALDWLAERWRSRAWTAWLPAGLFALLVLVNSWMLVDALKNGPLWFSDYGLGGMQYGARQLFTAVAAYRDDHPDASLIVSPNWANGTDVLARFFLKDPDRISLGSVDGHLFEEKPLDEHTVFVMLPEEYARASESGKFKELRIEQTLLYPDGQPGFSFVRMRYVDNIAEILEKEREARRELQKIRLTVDGGVVDLGYSMLDMGTPELFFDGDLDSVARSLEANPLVLDLWFEQPRQVEGLSVLVGRTNIQVIARLYFSDQEPLEFSASQREADELPQLRMDFGQAYLVQRLRLEIGYPDKGEPEHVHVWEVILR